LSLAECEIYGWFVEVASAPPDQPSDVSWSKHAHSTIARKRADIIYLGWIDAPDRPI